MLNDSFDEGDSLSQWLGLLKRFNSGRPLSLTMKDKIEKYFDYRWMNDKNQAVSTEEDQKLIEQLPSKVQTEIYSHFLFSIFLKNFRKFFEFPK
jgi:hypothetical protein